MEDARKVKGMDIKKVVDDPEWQGAKFGKISVNKLIVKSVSNLKCNSY